VKYLLDTNAWIAFFQDSKDLSDQAAEIMESDSGRCWISMASVWEAAIKTGLGKLKVDYDLEKDLSRLVERNGFHFLGLELGDAAAVQALEQIHRDPFDRIQVCQARRLGSTVLSSDPVFEKYGLKRIW
jgi:PIN domain nuclease of toxin-antitoxin system